MRLGVGESIGTSYRHAHQKNLKHSEMLGYTKKELVDMKNRNLVNLYRSILCLFIILFSGSITGFVRAVNENGGEFGNIGVIGIACALSALTFTLLFWVIIEKLIKLSYSKGLLDGFGNPIMDPKTILEDYDSIQVLKFWTTAHHNLCLIERKGEVKYVAFNKTYVEIKEKRFYRARHDSTRGRLVLRDQHEELAFNTIDS